MQPGYSQNASCMPAGLLLAFQTSMHLDGKVPEGLSEREEATYILRRELTRLSGSLSEDSFERAKKVLGGEMEQPE
jgi:hypothetical protein